MTEEGDAGVEELPESVFYERLHETHGSGCDPRIVLEDESSACVHPAEARIGKLRSHSPGSRYILRGEIGQGGMGTVYRAFDVDLRRIVAMKVMRAKGSRAPKSGGSPASSPGISRFLEEAQITGQLDHPGIVPVHELGIDAEDRVFFTMREVHGGNLRQTFEYFHSGRYGWNLTRCVGIVLRVCETMSYAHSRGVVHRDLKPENVMVGKYGEVVVLDWGLAKVLPRKKRTSSARSSPPIWTDRLHAQAHAQDLLAATQHGAVVGTPSFMAPEQAAGNVTETDARSDVYSVGAMLYFLLSGRAPYELPGVHTPRMELLAKVSSGPPTSIRLLVRKVPPEVVAICEKAMQRDPAERYASMEDLALDLRSYLEGQVVAAHGTGALRSLAKWTRKNRKTVTISGAAAAFAVIALAMAVRNERLWKSAMDAVGGTQAAARANEFLAQENATLRVDLERSRTEQLRLAEAARASEGQAGLQAAAVEQSLRLEFGRREALLRGEADALGARARTFQQELLAERDKLKAAEVELVEWRERGRRSEAALAVVASFRDVHRLISEAHALWPRYGAAVESYESWLLRARRAEAARTSVAAETLGHLEELGAPAAEIRAFLAFPAELIGAVEGRADFAREMADLLGVDRSQEWGETIEAIASFSRSRAYKRLRLTPQHGLVPLGRDPVSKLYEFAHIGTGDVPRRDGDTGELVFEARSALVFVLVPGGSFSMGFERAQDSAAVLSDSHTRPVHEVELEPFFLMKYEMTEAQWSRITGEAPTGEHGGLDPVAGVSWSTAVEVLGALGLRLPTEAQWEYAARAGTETPWWTDDLARRETAEGLGADPERASALIDNLEWNDGFARRAPVHAFAANPFGIHGLLGNVCEWTLDSWGRHNYEHPARAGDGRHEVSEWADDDQRSVRGGAYTNSLEHAHVAARHGRSRAAKDPLLGLRPARPVFP